MIHKPCDKCGVRLEVDDAQAGQRVTCPKCGDVNLMPGAGGSPPVAAVRKDRAAEAGLPPDSGPEQRVLHVRPAMLRARPMTFLLLVLAVLGGAAGVAAGFTGVGLPAAIIGGVVLAIAAIILLVWKIKTLGAALEVTNKRTVERRGLFSKATSEVLHDNIRNVQITQTFWQRMWRVGKIGISSSGQDGIEIELNDMPRPDNIRRVIDLYRPLG